MNLGWGLIDIGLVTLIQWLGHFTSYLLWNNKNTKIIVILSHLHRNALLQCIASLIYILVSWCMLPNFSWLMLSVLLSPSYHLARFLLTFLIQNSFRYIVLPEHGKKQLIIISLYFPLLIFVSFCCTSTFLFDFFHDHDPVLLLLTFLKGA